LRKSAYGARNIGTATPFSNNATICSFPLFCRENALPEGISLGRLDTLFAQANFGRSVDLPTAVGFCMYIKRDVLDEAGYFDEGRWGKGYGEENDFCLRAAALGWRHVAACDVFVEHKGARSFAEGKREHLKRNLAKLDALYPDYARTIQRFIAQDPLAGPRNRVIKELLKAHADSYLLFLMHHLGGGTQVAVDDLAARLGDEGIAVLELRCVAPDRWRLSGRGLPYTMDYRYPTDFDALVRDLRDLGVWHIHCHHTLGFPRKSLELPALLGTEYDVTVHDYLPICPRINLIDESGVYCGDAQYSLETCDGCIQVNGPHPDLARQYSEFGGHMAGWRAGYGDYLRGARRVFAPSRDTARRLRRHFQLLNLRVEPHPEPLRKIPGILRQGKPDTVAVLGAIGPHKGFDILLKCVRNAAKERLPLKFVVIGFTSDDDALKNYGNVTITGEYKSADLPGLIVSGGARVALFLSPWPETYSFTLSEAWQNQLFPVAFDLGAIAERIKKAQWGRLMPLTTEPKLINRVLLEVLSEERPVPETSTMGRTLRSVLKDYYGLHKPRSRTVVPVELNTLMGSGAGA
jgi:glycosyltransferase involved in cell wall biosynthesis